LMTTRSFARSSKRTVRAKPGTNGRRSINTSGQRGPGLSDSLRKRKKHLRERENFFRYVQWIASEQWSAIKAYAERRGVALMGDIPFGVNYYSADVFARPDEFAHDWCGGAPPGNSF